jgi:hypothetical protein
MSVPDIQPGDTVLLFNGSIDTAASRPVKGAFGLMISVFTGKFYIPVDLPAIVEVRRNGVIVYPSSQMSLWSEE